MKSVIYRLNTKEFPRIRVGIGMPENKSQLIEYVIGKMSEEEYKKYIPGIKKAKDAVKEVLKNGIDIAMNKIN